MGFGAAASACWTEASTSWIWCWPTTSCRLSVGYICTQQSHLASCVPWRLCEHNILCLNSIHSHSSVTAHVGSRQQQPGFDNLHHTLAVRAIAMLASQTLRAVTLTSCSNEAQMSLRASFCLADWATLPVVASTASPGSTDTCLLKASATLSALCCPCTKAYYLVVGKVNLLEIMI